MASVAAGFGYARIVRTQVSLRKDTSLAGALSAKQASPDENKRQTVRGGDCMRISGLDPLEPDNGGDKHYF